MYIPTFNIYKKKSGESAKSGKNMVSGAKKKSTKLLIICNTDQRFSYQLPPAEKLFCIVAEFYFRQPKQKIIKDGQAWPEVWGMAKARKEVRFFNVAKKQNN